MNMMQDKLEAIVEALDLVLGEGYAKKNPQLIGQAMQSDAMIVLANAIYEGFCSYDDEGFVQ